ncbi:MAG: hypothetical protein PF513_04620 [Tenericutes bacterium]|jgi:transposase-like protein|nr:hypothetical protein [Mycoplasmatota bacterium]
MKSNAAYQEKWFKVVKDYKESDLSMKKYASINDIKYYQFQYWIKKYNDKHKDPIKQFVKVETSKPMINDQLYKITYGKLTIELPEIFNESSLLKILKVVDQVV